MIIKIIIFILCFLIIGFCQEYKAVILNSGCSSGLLGSYCFTMVKIIDKDITLKLYENYGLRGDTLMVLYESNKYYKWRVK